MSADSRATPDWERLIHRWAHVGLEAAIFYIVLAAWARPRAGSALLLPLLGAATLPLGLGLRLLLEAAASDPLLRCAAVILPGLAWATALARFALPPDFGQATAGEPLLLAILLGSRAAGGLPPLVFWSSLLCWGRANLAPSWEPAIDETLLRFRLGCLLVGLVLTLAAVTDASDGPDLVQREQLLAVVIFFIFGLLATSLGRRRDVAGLDRRPDARSHPAPAAAGRRATPIVVAITLVSLAALLAIAWGAEAVVPSLLPPTIALLEMALSIAAVGLAALAGGAQVALTAVRPPIGPSRPPITLPNWVLALPTPRLPFLEILHWLALALSILGAVALLLLLALLVRYLVQRLGEREEGIDAVAGVDEEQAPPAIPSRGPVAVVALLVRVLTAVLRPPRIRPTRQSTHAAPPAIDEAPPGSIRGVYRSFLKLAGEHGVRRRPAETPDELCRRLAQSYPSLAGPVALLTGLYVALRYGERRCTPAELREAQQTLERLRRDLRKPGT